MTSRAAGTPARGRAGVAVTTVVDRLADVASLGVVWLLACLPVLTWLPATAALVTTVGEVHTGDTDRPLRRYASVLRHTLRRGVPLGAAWSGLGGLLILSLSISQRMPGPAGVACAVGGWLVLGGWGVVGTVLPVALSRPPGEGDVLARAVRLAGRLPAAAVAGLLLWLTAAGLVLLWPAAVVAVGGLVGSGLHLLFRPGVAGDR
ncbi:MAG: DUF624 domain-containing protein [Kineosporiaceae bacterium]